MKKAILFLFLLLTKMVLVAQNLLVSGPMLGYVEHREVAIWIEASPIVQKAELVYWEKGSISTKKTAIFEGNFKNSHHPIRFILGELKMNTSYEYEIVLDGKKQKIPFPTVFKTKELWEWRKPAPDFSFLFGSCAYLNDSIYDRPGKPYGNSPLIFEAMAKEKADFNLWLGDNTYLREADYSSASGIYYRYSHDRANPFLQPLLGARPNYMIWDDHDFGPNNSDKSFPLKEVTAEAFKNYSANKVYGENDRGIYSQFTYSDCDFFLMDNRSFRSSDYIKDSLNGKPNPNKYFWGKEQMEWFKNALVNSKASYKFLVNGGQILNGFDSEAMRNFSAEWQELMDFIRDYKIKGVVILSGDRHLSEILQYPINESITLYELTNSPFTSGYYSSMKEPELSNPLRVKGSLINTANNFGKVSIVGEKKNRKLVYEVFGVDGKKLYEWEVSIKN